MEQELDLRPYLQAVLRRWKLILGLGISLMIIAMAILLVRPQSSIAVADVLIIPTTSQVTLDQRFIDRDGSLVTNPVLQRQALINLATSTTLEVRVASEFQEVQYEPGILLNRIDIDARSDLLRISATAPTIEEARRLAELWARGYEQLVNEVYSGIGITSETVALESASAQGRYNEAQAELERFYAQSGFVQIEQQTKSIEALLDGSREAGTSLYTQYLSRTQELDLVIEDARALREQIAVGEQGNAADSIAALVLRARAVAGGDAPLQLQVGASPLAENSTSADLDQLIRALESSRARLLVEAQSLAAALVEGDASVIGIDSEMRQRYEDELARLQGTFARLEGEESLLLQRRSVALESLALLQRKSDEERIRATNPLISVRFVSTTLDTPSSLLVRFLIPAVAALVIGLFGGLMLAFYLEVVRQGGRAPGLNMASQEERSADQPVSSS